MRKPILAILALILANLSCGGTYLATVTPQPTVTPAAVSTQKPPRPSPTVTRTAEATSEARVEATAVVSRAVVNVRKEPGGVVIGSVQAGDVVIVLECLDEYGYCRIEEPAGWVWIGCLDGMSDKGCEAK